MVKKIKYTVTIRTLAILLLFAMFHYVAGYRLMYSLGILYTKEEAKQCISEKSNVKKLTFCDTDYNSLKWSEQNKEFSFNNQMYDVVNIQKLGANYQVTAYPDDPETELITAFHNFEKEFFHPDQSSKGAKSAETIMDSFQKEYTPVSEFKINIFTVSGLFLPSNVATQHLLTSTDNIWHPPAIC